MREGWWEFFNSGIAVSLMSDESLEESVMASVPQAV